MIAAPAPSTPFGLSGDQWWTDPWRGHDALMDRHVLGEEPGLFIDAPPAIDLGRRTTAPLLLFRAARERDAWGADLTSAYAVAVRAEDHAVRVGLPVRRAGMEEGPTGRSSDRVVGERRLGDLAALGLDEGTWHIHVVLGAQRSNRVRVAVTRSPRGWQDPAVVAFLAARRLEHAQRVAEPPQPWPPRGAPWPTYKPEPSSLALPAREALDIELQKAKRPGRTIALLRGAVRRPTLPRERVPAGSTTEWGGLPPSAVLDVTLVACGSLDPGPRVVVLRVPSYDPLADGVATALFALEVGALFLPLVGRGQTLSLDALSGTTVDQATLEWTAR